MDVTQCYRVSETVIYFCKLDFYVGMFLAFLGKLIALFFGYAYESQVRVWGVAPLVRFFLRRD